MFIPDFFPSRIPDPDPGSRGQKSTGSRIRISNTGHTCTSYTRDLNPRIRIRALTSHNAILGQLFLISIMGIILQFFISYIKYHRSFLSEILFKRETLYLPQEFSRRQFEQFYSYCPGQPNKHNKFIYSIHKVRPALHNS
jgi:hypothetical protein